MLRRATILLMCLASASALAKPLSTEDQAVLADSTSNTCLAGQLKSAANQKMKIGQLQDFCSCYGKDLAKAIPAEELEKGKGDMTPEMSRLANVSLQTCLAGMKK